jgi:hypothetical protein
MLALFSLGESNAIDGLAWIINNGTREYFIKF